MSLLQGPVSFFFFFLGRLSQEILVKSEEQIPIYHVKKIDL
jgi:hypothetical protein